MKSFHGFACLLCASLLAGPLAAQSEIRIDAPKGRLGWLAWLGLHLWYLVGFRNRLRVLINWTWRYFDWPSGPRLIVADAETVD